MKNKELQELLKQYPSDLPIIYFHPTKDIQTIFYIEERKLGKNEKEVLSIEFGDWKK